MSSKKVEDAHSGDLKKLLYDSGLECRLPPSITPEESEEELEYETEDEGEYEEETVAEEVQPEEKPESVVEELSEKHSFVFPTPSLRRVVPDRLRKIEGQNRIHTLPESFKCDIDPALIPKINTTAQQKYIDILAEMVGCKKYKSSLAEYWFLDTLANLLRRAQEDQLHRSTQAVLICWFCEWMKEMQYFDAADRQRMLRRWEDNMMTAAKFIAEENYLPTPEECGVYYKGQDVIPAKSRISNMTFPSRTGPAESIHPAVAVSRSIGPDKSMAGDSKHAVEFDNSYACSLRDLTKITHYIYDLFSTDYQYDLVRSIFCSSPEYRQIDPPFQMRVPKRIYAPLKAKPPPKSPKKDQKGKPAKGKKMPDTEEYLMLMQFKALDLKRVEEQQEVDREDWNKRSHILPLNFADTEELFDLYWPPPPVEVVPEPVPEQTKAKPKGKGKK